MKKTAFLSAYRITASITKAAAAADIERTLHYRWLEEDPEYAKAFAAAKLEAGELIEDEAVRRAHEGFDEPVVYQGRISKDEYEQPLVVRKYSDALLMKLMDGFLPEKYKRRTGVELTGKDGGPVQVEAEGLKRLSDEELAALLELTKKLKSE